MPYGVAIVSYVDDIEVNILSRDVYAALMPLNQVMRSYRLDMRSHTRVDRLQNGDCASHEKSYNTVCHVEVDNATVRAKEKVVVDNKLTFKAQIEEAAVKVAAVTTTLSRVITNIH